MGTYDGPTPLETFLAKFENCTEYYNWDERERLHHLRASLERDAGQVFWDSAKRSTVEEVIQLLKDRFGGQNKCERYTAELKNLKRKKGESLQTVCHETRRLMALAFSGQSGPLWETLARDSFLDALGGAEMRLRVAEKDPATLDDTLKYTCRLEAIGRTTAPVGDE